MPTLPAISRSWRYRVNVDATEASDTAHRATLALLLKQSLVGAGTGWTDSNGSSVAAPTAWSVVASSDSVTANASDNWVDAGDLVWDTDPDAHSWIVFRHANYFGTSDPLFLLLDLSEASAATRGGTMGVYLSRVGFDLTTPVVTTRPVATDEVAVIVTNGTMTTAAWQGSDTNDEDHRTGRFHFVMSDDGRAFWVAICRLSTCTAFWDLYRLDEWLDTSVSIPVAMAVMSRDADTELLTWANIQTQTYMHYVSRDSTIGGLYRARMAIPVATGSNTSVTAMAACNLGGVGSSGLSAIDVQGITPAAGLVGTLVDMWAGRAANAGLHYPDDGSRTFVQLGVIARPWNGSQVLLT